MPSKGDKKKGESKGGEKKETKELKMSKFAYVGTYGGRNGKGNGIYVYQVEPSTGSLNFLETVVSDSVSFMCVNQKRDRLYVVNELSEHNDQHGEVTAFKVDAGTGKLTPLNKLSSLGVWPCHISLDPSEKFVFVSNYESGSLDTFSLKPDGSLDKHADRVVNEGSGPNPDRQTTSHTHMLSFDGKGKHAILVDLGIDKALLYKFDVGTGKMTSTGVTCDANPGSGPRHLVESQDGRFYYVINELDATISVFSSEKSEGKCPMVQTVSTLPSDVKDKVHKQCSEIMFHPNGKFLYGSNRGHDSIAIYSVDINTGLLTLLDNEPTQGSFPRHFQIHPTNGQMYVANHRSDNIVIFKINDISGKLTPTGEVINVPAPAYVQFI